MRLTVLVLVTVLTGCCSAPSGDAEAAERSRKIAVERCKRVVVATRHGFESELDQVIDYARQVRETGIILMEPSLAENLSRDTAVPLTGSYPLEEVLKVIRAGHGGEFDVEYRAGLVILWPR
jgi:hypothetical protein